MIKNMGWIPDYPDFRDWDDNKKEIRYLLKKTSIIKAKSLPKTVDLRKWCSPVKTQGSLGSCTAQAIISLLEYYEKKAFKKYIEGSRNFLYKVTRKLLKWEGDSGAFIRTTIGAIVLFGVPPEEYWPYDEKKYDIEPTPFCYAFAQNYKTIKYYRLDSQKTSKNTLLKKIKHHLASGLALVFGFSVYSSFTQADNTGKLPYPCPHEKSAGGHALMAVGYSDTIEIKNKNCNNKTKGAILIKNSWGSNWGEEGYGWLPYDYILNGLAIDWWTIIKNEWVDTDEFK
jgi:C1A family cysteine protease